VEGASRVRIRAQRERADVRHVTSAARRSSRITLALLTIGVVCAVPATAQDATPDAAGSPPADVETPFDRSPTEVPDTEPSLAPSDQAIDAETDKEVVSEGDKKTVLSDDTVQQPGWGSAADQSQEAKRDEAEEDCEGARPPVSQMLGLPSEIVADRGSTLGWLILATAAGALVVAGLAYGMRRRRGGSGSRGTLETVATVVGILGGVAGLAVQFVPGVGVQERPAPAATMAVSDVNARITHLEYTRETNGEELAPEDELEVGNVIWLEIHLEGYRDKLPSLQYALYDPDAGRALLPGTPAEVRLRRVDADAETRFVPIWVGHPQSKRFQAAFRLLDSERVQAFAETGEMRASRYRYSCRRDS